MKTFIVIVMIVVMAGCAGFGSVTTTVTNQNGEVWKVVSKSDALVEFQQGEFIKGKVDNRGRPSLFEKIISILFLSLPDIEVVR